MSLEAVNRSWFQLLNARPDPPPEVVALAQFGAKWLVYALVAGLALAWVPGGHGLTARRRVCCLDGGHRARREPDHRARVAPSTAVHGRARQPARGARPRDVVSERPRDVRTRACFRAARRRKFADCPRSVRSCRPCRLGADLRGRAFPLDMLGSLVVSLAVGWLPFLTRDAVDARIVPRVHAVYLYTRRRLRLPLSVFPE